MKRTELILEKLSQIPQSEVLSASKELTKHVKARLRINSMSSRIRYGAHSESYLGIDPVDYYVGETFKKLYDPEGWDWKFETRTFAEQLIVIANKLISDMVKQYKSQEEFRLIRIDADISELHYLKQKTAADEVVDIETFNLIHDLAIEASKHDDEFLFFTPCYLNNESFYDIATDMNIDLEDVYYLKKKLIRRTRTLTMQRLCKQGFSPIKKDNSLLNNN